MVLTRSARNIIRNVSEGAANTLLEFTTPAQVANNPYKLLWVSVTYSGAATQTGIIVELISGAGSTKNARLTVGAANDQFFFFQPTDDLILSFDDVIKVSAPAGGVGVVAAIVAQMQEEI